MAHASKKSTFIGKVKERHGLVVAKAEAPILWPPDVKSQVIRRDPDVEKD